MGQIGMLSMFLWEAMIFLKVDARWILSVEFYRIEKSYGKCRHEHCENPSSRASSYIMTGYYMPYAAEEESGGDSGCSIPSNYVALSDAIRAECHPAQLLR